MGNINHNYSNKKKLTRIRNIVSCITLTYFFRNIVFQRSDVKKIPGKNDSLFSSVDLLQQLGSCVLHQNRTASVLLTNLGLDNY